MREFNKLIFIFVLSLFFSTSILFSAPIKNFAIQLNQPDGKIINCFVSGDEYFNWIHDNDGYIIVLDKSTGFYTYGVQQEQDFIPSKYIVGSINPEDYGFNNKIDFNKINISDKRKLFSNNIISNSKTPTTGILNNLVVFIRFSDEGEFNQPLSYYENMFNNSSENYNSMSNYFKEVSYNKLNLISTFYPTPSNNVISYKDSKPRSYYQPSSGPNSNGYTDDNDRTEREHLLLKNAVTYIAQFVPANLVIDGDSDGYIDNICFIISGSPNGWSSLLWPHMWSLYSQSAYINGKRVMTYDFQLQNFLTTSSVGVLCHEMFHSLGSPDLYHYTDNGISPVGAWDLMENDLNPPQHMGAHMKYKYGLWIESIPTISTDGEYSLSPLSSPENNCYKIASPKSTNEYFVLEYRKRNTIFESSLFGEGLLVYRIDRRYEGNADGPPDEVFIYRPGGGPNKGGVIGNANLSVNIGRTFINSASDPKIFLANGTAGGISIYDIGEVQNTISFKVHIENSLITLYPNGGENFNSGDTVSINWDNFGSTTSYKVEYTLDNGTNWNLISDNLPSSQKTIKWITPDVTSFQCKIRVSSYLNNSILDESDAVFSIIPEGNYNVTLINSLKVNGFSNSLTVNNNKAYICSRGGGLHIVDISDENNLNYLGGYNSDGSSVKVKIIDSIAYLSDETKGIKILNISNPSNIELLSSLNFNGQAVSSAVLGNILYVANKEYGIRIFDITNLYQPVEKGLIAITGNARDLLINGNLLYVAAETGGLRIFDISNLLNPIEIGYVDTPGSAFSLLLKNNLIYLADKTGGLRIIDISNPNLPKIISYINTVEKVSGVSVDNEYAVIACENSGIAVYSIIDPANPVKVGFYHKNLYAYDVQIIDNKIFVVDLANGIIVFENDLISSVEDTRILPNDIYLYQNYPNPFNPVTKIKFSIPSSGFVSLKIYDILGKIVQEKKFDNISGGIHEVEFNANKMASGVYLYSIEYENKIISKKMLLLK